MLVVVMVEQTLWSLLKINLRFLLNTTEAILKKDGFFISTVLKVRNQILKFALHKNKPTLCSII